MNLAGHQKLRTNLSAAMGVLLTCLAGVIHADSEPSLGMPTAPVTIIEYGSLTCDSCVKFHREVLPTVKQRYIDSGRVRFVFRDFPTGEAAVRGAAAARCVRPEAYYRMLDALFWSVPQWSRAANVDRALVDEAAKLSLANDSFGTCFGNKEVVDRLEQQQRRATKDYAVLGTPTFVINGRVVRGAQTLEQIEALIAQAKR
jgi:protein-disulfide isomerase